MLIYIDFQHMRERGGECNPSIIVVRKGNEGGEAGKKVYPQKSEDEISGSNSYFITFGHLLKFIYSCFVWI